MSILQINKNGKHVFTVGCWRQNRSSSHEVELSSSHSPGPWNLFFVIRSFRLKKIKRTLNGNFIIKVIYNDIFNAKGF